MQDLTRFFETVKLYSFETILMKQSQLAHDTFARFLGEKPPPEENVEEGEAEDTTVEEEDLDYTVEEEEEIYQEEYAPETVDAPEEYAPQMEDTLEEEVPEPDAPPEAPVAGPPAAELSCEDLKHLHDEALTAALMQFDHATTGVTANDVESCRAALEQVNMNSI